MEVTVDAENRVHPPNFAMFLTWKPVVEKLVEGHDMPESDIAIFLCNGGQHTFEAPKGEVTTHTCDSPEPKD